MTAADGGECNIQKQSRAKKASSRREQLLTDSAGEEKKSAKMYPDATSSPQRPK
nr:hypothetical protein [Klebsiella pneumoniae]